MKKTQRCSIISIEQSVFGVEDVEVDIPSKYRIVSRNEVRARCNDQLAKWPSTSRVVADSEL